MRAKLKDFFSISDGSKYDQTKFLTGFRAYAALGVMLIHYGGAGLRGLGESGNKIVDFGKYGVIVFFVLSAFTIINSIDHSKNFNYASYLIRRLCRILPLYIIGLFVVLFVLGYANITPDKVKEFFISISFINILDIGFRNNIIGVEWTIPIEVFFYIIMPAIFFYLTNKNLSSRLISLVLIGGIISLCSVKFSLFHYFNFTSEQLALMYSVERYAFTYSIGISLYYVLKQYKNLKTTSTTLFLLIAVLIAFIILQSNDGFINIVFVTLWTALLIVVCLGRNRLAGILFENRIIQYLGTISYSIYLSHFVILNYISGIQSKVELFAVGFVLTVIISSITYFFIEKPFINLGKRLTTIKRPESITEVA